MSAKNLFADSGLGVLFTERRDFYLSPNITKELWPDVAPFTTLLANRRTVTGLKDPMFKLFEHRNPWIKQRFQVNSTVVNITANNTACTGIDVDNITGLKSSVDASWVGLECEVWDSTLTTKKGVVLITAATDADTIAVKNLTSTAFATADNDYFIVVGNAHGEGTEAPEAWADDLSIVWNQAQIFKTPVEITGTLKEAVLRGESDELARLRLQKMQEHKMQKEHAFLKGTARLGTNMDGSGTFADGLTTDANGNVVRTTYGIISAIEKYGSSDVTNDDQNIFTINSAAYDYANFVDDMEKVFRYVPNSGEKYAFCGPKVISYWSKMSSANYFAGNSGWSVHLMNAETDVLGFKIQKLITPHGIINLVLTHALKDQYAGYMVIVDENHLSHVIYRNPQFQTNIKTDNAYDGFKDQYFSDEGVGIQLLEAHKLFKVV